MNIKDKLTRELVRRIESEQQVVYILAEIRKYLEQQGQLALYPGLVFGCNWALHSRLRGPEAQRIAGVLNSYEQWLAENPDKGPIDAGNGLLQELSDNFRLNQFRRDLAAFLRAEMLPAQVVDDDKRWLTFFWQYASVIQDCPLESVSQGLRYNDRVIVEVVSVVPRDEGRVVKVGVKWTWRLVLTGGESQCLSYFYASSPAQPAPGQ